ncbi:MAG TPA: hypothetical protein PK995_07940 [Bacteroidia bacterium]|nr:hypothetical protein [Bacteroidia bacterium]
MDELVDYWEKVTIRTLNKKKIKIINKESNYLFDSFVESKYTCLYTIKIPKSEIWEADEKDRSIDFSIDYWKKFRIPDYNGMYEIEFKISSGINSFLDCEIWILEYLYRNNVELFYKLFNGRDIYLFKADRGTEVEYYQSLFFYENELDYVKYIIKEVMDWILNRKEIKEILEGKRWIKGYIPPSPY